MNVISNRGLQTQIKNHPDCHDAANQWFYIAVKANWGSLGDVRKSFSSADQVGQVLIFNLRGNAYRLIVTAHYPSKTLFVKALLSHAEYDRKEWMKWA